MAGWYEVPCSLHAVPRHRVWKDRQRCRASGSLRQPRFACDPARLFSETCATTWTTGVVVTLFPRIAGAVHDDRGRITALARRGHESGLGRLRGTYLELKRKVRHAERLDAPHLQPADDSGSESMVSSISKYTTLLPGHSVLSTITHATHTAKLSSSICTHDPPRRCCRTKRAAVLNSDKGTTCKTADCSAHALILARHISARNDVVGPNSRRTISQARVLRDARCELPQTAGAMHRGPKTAAALHYRPSLNCCAVMRPEEDEAICRRVHFSLNGIPSRLSTAAVETRNSG